MMATMQCSGKGAANGALPRACPHPRVMSAARPLCPKPSPSEMPHAMAWQENGAGRGRGRGQGIGKWVRGRGNGRMGVTAGCMHACGSSSREGRRATCSTGEWAPFLQSHWPPPPPGVPHQHVLKRAPHLHACHVGAAVAAEARVAHQLLHALCDRLVLTSVGRRGGGAMGAGLRSTRACGGQACLGACAWSEVGWGGPGLRARARMGCAWCACEHARLHPR